MEKDTLYLVSNHSVVIVLATMNTNPIPRPDNPLKIIFWRKTLICTNVHYTLLKCRKGLEILCLDEVEALWLGMIELISMLLNINMVLKSALRIILGDKYVDYDNALKVLNLQSLRERREDLCLKFAKKCLQVPKLKRMFPRNHHDHDMNKRKSECFRVNRGLTERLRRSAIPHMQRLLNEHEGVKRKICKQIDSFMPVNNGLSVNLYH